ncbi:MAG: polyhydroxyalkanoate depolymerase, partial [Polymorphobacter sp.]
MLYTSYEINRSWLATMGRVAQFNSRLLLNAASPMSKSPASPVMARALEVFAHAVAPRGKPDFGLQSTIIDGKTVAVSEAVVLRKPFGQLKHFVRETKGRNDPRVIVV